MASKTFRITRQGITTGTLIVNFTVGGTALANTDYTITGATSFSPPNGSATIVPGQSFVDLVFEITGDTLVE